MLTPGARFLLVLNLAVVALGCEDDNFTDPPAPPAAVPPQIGVAPDAGVPAAPKGFMTVTTWDTGIRNGPPPLTGDVELSSQALLGDGQRNVWNEPGQTHGEAVIWKWQAGMVPQGQVDQGLILQTNGQWDLCSPTLHWFDGSMQNDQVRQVGGYAYDKRCLKVQVFSEWMFGGTVTEYKACAGPGAYQNLGGYPTDVSSIKTFYYTCPNYPTCP
jgi:hypothetical protein